MEQISDKDEVITNVLRYLEHTFGTHAYKVVDHWEADRLAVGIAHPLDATRLAYLAHDNETPPTYTVILERGSPPGLDLPYEDCGHFKTLNLEAVAAIVSCHLGITDRQGA